MKGGGGGTVGGQRGTVASVLRNSASRSRARRQASLETCSWMVVVVMSGSFASRSDSLSHHW